MMEGLTGEMIEMAKNGISPVNAVDKRLAAHKLQAFNLAKKFELLPANASADILKDSSDFWTKSFSPQNEAQTQAEVTMENSGTPITV